jgi:hypothetical protein
MSDIVPRSYYATTQTKDFLLVSYKDGAIVLNSRKNILGYDINFHL